MVSRPLRQPRRWPWFVAAMAMLCLFALAAVLFVSFLDDDGVSAPPSTSAPSTTMAPTTTVAPAPVSFVPPQGPPDCPPSTPEDIAAVNAVLVYATASGSTGLTLGMAAAVQVDAVRYISGDVYDSTGARLGVADVWVVVDGVVVATSETAIALTTTAARPDLYPAPGTPGSEVVACRQIIPPAL